MYSKKSYIVKRYYIKIIIFSFKKETYPLIPED
ncbi:hypothetical protein L3N51_01288 [Metallosphaera sp. J1]|nr:hypothetical protein [Metallosphaera javensis (ex Hofmann et al. 2022)]